jgi:hypothetical protein
MGSGMLPPGAYVTLEHEYILILRKGNKREFGDDAAKTAPPRERLFLGGAQPVVFRRVDGPEGNRSAPFRQRHPGQKRRLSFRTAYRLINMFSVKGDTVLDPFLGIGTTLYAAMAAARNSIGFEIDPGLQASILDGAAGIVAVTKTRIRERLRRHTAFVHERYGAKGKFRYANRHYGFPVVTGQERELFFNELLAVKQTGGASFEAVYGDGPREKSRAIGKTTS